MSVVVRQIKIPRVEPQTLSVELLAAEATLAFEGVRILTTRDGTFRTSDSIYIESEELDRVIEALQEIKRGTQPE